MSNKQRRKIAQLLADAKPDDWGLLMAAFAAVYAIGLLGVLVMPFMVGATMNGLHLDEAQAGLLGTVEFLGVMGSSLAVAPFMKRVPRRKLAIFGVALAIGGNALSMIQTSYETLLLLRLVVGIGCGVAIAVGNATVASVANPEKLAGQMSMLGALLACTANAVFARVSEQWNQVGVYGALVVFLLAVSIFLIKLPQKAVAPPLGPSPTHPHAHIGLFTKSAVFMLFAMFAFSLRDTMAWAFSERIGQVAGYSLRDIGNLFSIQAALGVVGPLIALVIGSRYGLRKPVILGVVLAGIVSFTILRSYHAKVPFTVAIICLAGTYYYALAYLTALAAELDSGGRVVAASGAFLVGGVAAGPAVSGYLIIHGGFELVSWVCAAIVVLTVALLIVPLTSLSHRFKRIASLGA